MQCARNENLFLLKIAVYAQRAIRSRVFTNRAWIWCTMCIWRTIVHGHIELRIWTYVGTYVRATREPTLFGEAEKIVEFMCHWRSTSCCLFPYSFKFRPLFDPLQSSVVHCVRSSIRASGMCVVALAQCTVYILHIPSVSLPSSARQQQHQFERFVCVCLTQKRFVTCSVEKRSHHLIPIVFLF